LAAPDPTLKLIILQPYSQAAVTPASADEFS
jgi:hypothetical protein